MHAAGYDNLLAVYRSTSILSVLAGIAGVLVLRSTLRAARRKLKTTSLRGPPGTHPIFGASKDLFESPDTGEIFETWAEEYGVAYEVPTSFGGKKIMLCDPRALAHYYARETWTYFPCMFRLQLDIQFGRGILWSHGEDHKRQRKSLSPAFSHAALRKLSHIFYNCAHKTKAGWDALIDMSGGESAIIEIQDWMNHISLDTIGMAGFSHDFGSLDGKPATIQKVFSAFDASAKQSFLDIAVVLFAEVFPVFSYIPVSCVQSLTDMQETLSGVAKNLLERMEREQKEGVIDGKEDKSIIGVLIKATEAEGGRHVTPEEVLSSMKELLLAGYITTSNSLTWALVELARNPDIQSKLRDELLAFGSEPTYDQLQSSQTLPYLDAVVHESLRIHPPLTDFVRVAAEDDVIPLSEPVITKSGQAVNSISVARGTRIGLPLAYTNRSTAIWGPDAKVFRPERWLERDGIPKKAQDVQGYRHLLTFADGPRNCLGKGFAVSEIKAVLSVLVKSFTFEMRDGPDTQIELCRGILPRPRIVGEEGTAMPLRVTRYEGF
ncbi:cytochrome P450 [Pisolithus orientalis]|uniref:cytochrome P450 n=1 Tax=Pisolithus orientalis TaxID=936130 RepID=UPI002224936E|nr:cytochrome P450 [Pisolithus orientalis]KAI6012677.1 cytochrome P450 [Pisolithus orientalis]